MLVQSLLAQLGANLQVGRQSPAPSPERPQFYEGPSPCVAAQRERENAVSARHQSDDERVRARGLRRAFLLGSVGVPFAPAIPELVTVLREARESQHTASACRALADAAFAAAQQQEVAHALTPQHDI